MTGPLTVLVPGQVWVEDYTNEHAGARFNAIITVLWMEDARLLVHSPCYADDLARSEVSALGDVAFIVAPGSFHHLHVASAQKALPVARRAWGRRAPSRFCLPPVAGVARADRPPVEARGYLGPSHRCETAVWLSLPAAAEVGGVDTRPENTHA